MKIGENLESHRRKEIGVKQDLPALVALLMSDLDRPLSPKMSEALLSAAAVFRSNKFRAKVSVVESWLNVRVLDFGAQHCSTGIGDWKEKNRRTGKFGNPRKLN